MACNAAITEKHTRSQMIREEVGGLMPTPSLKSASQSIRQNRSSLSDGDSIIDQNATAVFADDVDKTAFGIDNSDNNCAGNHEGLSAVKCVSMNDVKSVRNHSANNHRIKSGCIEGEGMSRGYVEEEKTSPCAGSSSSAKRSSQHSTLSTCFGDESSIEDREILSSLLLDEESIARHLCTANIPGE